MLKVPYVRQKADYTCGPAALSMVLQNGGIKAPMDFLIKQCRAHKNHGTNRRTMAKIMREYGFACHGHSGSSVNELRQFIKAGVPLIVNYREHVVDDRHYAVVIGISADKIIMHDPYHGPNFTVSIPLFVKSWYGLHRTVNRRWMLAASNWVLDTPVRCCET